MRGVWGWVDPICKESAEPVSAQLALSPANLFTAPSKMSPSCNLVSPIIFLLTIPGEVTLVESDFLTHGVLV